MEYPELKTVVLENNPKANFDLISKAWEFARKAHAGQNRATGEEYFVHVAEVAKTLAEMRLDSATIAAGILHDVIEDCGVRPETIQKEFGEEVLHLVEGTTKHMDLKAGDEELRAENIRKVILATAKDIRVIFIKLADRLHNMRTIRALPSSDQQRIARETMDIYAPIAYKLGINKIKAELEDLAFRILQPETYQEFKTRMGKKKTEREQDVERFITRLSEVLKKHTIPVRVFGRVKHFFSIYRKMQRKNLKFEEVTDLIAVRVVTTSIENCYKILGILHSMWRPIPGKFDDYISSPKPNLYQSLHTEILNDEGYPVEVQIRTLDMHHVAEEGIAAHWRYKGTERDKMFEHKINWLKQILTWKRESANAREFIESLKVDLFKDEIIVFTPKGDPITLPEGASPIDFAYEVHTSIGRHCRQAKVNGKIVPLDFALQSGDMVEIITQQSASPNRQWLNFVKTTNARQKIRALLGISVTENEARRPKETALSETDILSRVIINNVKPHDLRYAHCCTPLLEDRIIGFVQKDHKVAIHKQECPNVAGYDATRTLPAQFQIEPGKIEKTFDLVVTDRIGLLAEVLNMISIMNLNVSTINSKPAKERVRVIISLQLRNQGQIPALMQKFEKIVGVHEVHLLEGGNRVRKRA